MSIQLVDKDMKKGLAIIVGDRVDGVLLHTANVVGNRVEVLDKVKIESNESIIYLIGHGSSCKHKMTINSKTIKEICNKLVKAGYTGQQMLYPIVCHFCDNKNGKRMCDCFEEELKQDLNINSINIEKKSYGKSIVIKNNSKREMYCSSDKHTLIKTIIQGWFIIHNGMYFMNNLKMSDIEYKKVELFKRYLIEKFGGVNMNGELSGYAHIFMFIFGSMLGLFLSIALGVLYNHNIGCVYIQDNKTYIISIVIGVIIWGISLFKLDSKYEILSLIGLILGGALVTIGILLKVCSKFMMYMDMISLFLLAILVLAFFVVEFTLGYMEKKKDRVR